MKTLLVHTNINSFKKKQIMKSILITLTLLSFSAQATDFDVQSFMNKTFITIGVAHKIQETNYLWMVQESSPKKALTARIELYYQYSDNIKIGISHHSQYFKGSPFDDDFEYAKTEIFIDYTFSLSN